MHDAASSIDPTTTTSISQSVVRFKLDEYDDANIAPVIVILRERTFEMTRQIKRIVGDFHGVPNKNRLVRIIEQYEDQIGRDLTGVNYSDRYQSVTQVAEQLASHIAESKPKLTELAIIDRALSGGEITRDMVLSALCNG